jgi:hypothetical protein
MILRRSALLIELHIAISRRVRPQPVHWPEASSMTQILRHGLSMAGLGFCRFSMLDMAGI